MLDAILHFLLLPAVGWIVVIGLLSCTFWTVTSANWFWATVLHVVVVWFASVFFQIQPSLDNLLILAAIYFIIGAVNSVLQWYFTVQSIAKSFRSALINIVRHSLGNSIVDKATRDIASASSDDVIFDRVSAINLRPVNDGFQTEDDLEELYERSYSAFGTALSSATNHIDLPYTQSKILSNSFSTNRSDYSHTDFLTVGSMRKLYKPIPSMNKSYLVAWIVFWPTILVWTLVSKPVRYIGNYVYDTLGSVYQRISDSAFK